MNVRALCRLAGLLLLLIWTSRVVDPAYSWIFPGAAHSPASAMAEISPRDTAAPAGEHIDGFDEQPSLSMSSQHVEILDFHSPRSSLPFLIGALLLLWCPAWLQRFLEAANRTTA